MENNEKGTNIEIITIDGMLTISPERYSLLTKTANNCRKLAKKKSNEEVIELIKNRPELNDVEKQLLISDILCGYFKQQLIDYLEENMIGWFELYTRLRPLRNKDDKRKLTSKSESAPTNKLNSVLFEIKKRLGIDNECAIINKLTELLILDYYQFRVQPNQKTI